MFELILVYLILNSVFASEVTMANEIVGSYKLEKSENFDAFMKEIGVGYLKRQAAGEFDFGESQIVAHRWFGFAELSLIIVFTTNQTLSLAFRSGFSHRRYQR